MRMYENRTSYASWRKYGNCLLFRDHAFMKMILGTQAHDNEISILRSNSLVVYFCDAPDYSPVIDK